LVTVLAHDQSLARALAGVKVAAQVVDSSENVACTLFASLWVLGGQIPEALSAHIASSSLHVLLAVTRTGIDFALSIGNRVTNSVIERTQRVAVTWLACIRALNVFIWIAVEEWNALLAMLSLSVVLAVVANAATHSARVLVNGLIKVAARGVVVAVAF
jgi:hypothetical protein